MLCLTDRQLSIVRQLVHPRCEVPTSFVVPIFDRWYTYPTAELYADYVNETDSLVDKLGSEGDMACSEIIDLLTAISAALELRDTIGLSWNNSSLPAGSVNISSSQVPAGSTYVLTNICFVYTGTAPTRIVVNARVSASNREVYAQNAPASNIRYDRQGAWHLKAGEYLTTAITGATAGDACFCHAVGYVVTDP